jgi:DNA-binding beta-propeller fold protein YncE
VKTSVKFAVAILFLALLAGSISTLPRSIHLGRQPDGKYLVSSGQMIKPGTVEFEGRPSDFALHPTQDLVAVMTNKEIFIATPKGVLARTEVPLPENTGVSYQGIVWTPSHQGIHWRDDGLRFVVSTDQGYLQEYLYADFQIETHEKIWLVPQDKPKQIWPGGMCLAKNGTTLYVAEGDLNAVAQVDLSKHKKVKEFPVENFPSTCRLSGDGKTLIVANWGGKLPKPGELTSASGALQIAVNKRGSAKTGTVTLIELATGDSRSVQVGIHPNAIAVRGNLAYVANGMSDTISEVDIAQAKVRRTFPILLQGKHVLGAMPNALTLHGHSLLVCNGGDNALCEIDLKNGRVKGYRPAGYFPCAVTLTHDGSHALVLNSKGNGSVFNTNHGNPGGPHDFVGTISVLNLRSNLHAATQEVAKLNHWNENRSSAARALAVYNGAIKHVLYIIKENQSYDSYYGDMGIGNGDPSLCVFGERVVPNHRKIAREFTLFDNGYVSGTNSADGHSWSTQAMANDYLEKEYVGYRTYPDDGDCALALSSTGGLWDAAIKAHRSLRFYGEFCDDDTATITPMPKDWFKAWADRQSGQNKLKYYIDTKINSLKPYISHEVLYWPLLESDQHRADVFIRDYKKFVKEDKVPNLMVLCLPCDHSNGMDPAYPTIRAMTADNDLALGRVVEAVTKSKRFKDTAIFVIEDDGQSLPDHVDGHRTIYSVISPYNKRHTVDNALHTGVDMIRSIEMMLKLKPMNRFDYLARPITTCFQNTPNLKPFAHVANHIPLDERNKPIAQLDPVSREWFKVSQSLDWSHRDSPDPDKWARLNWFVLSGGKPFPERYGPKPEYALARDND